MINVWKVKTRPAFIEWKGVESGKKKKGGRGRVVNGSWRMKKGKIGSSGSHVPALRLDNYVAYTATSFRTGWMRQ
jgi:hypothetical protein